MGALSRSLAFDSAGHPSVVGTDIQCGDERRPCLEQDQARAEIRGVLDQFVGRYGAMDAGGVVALFAGDEAVVVGTGADEVRFGLDEIRSQVERDIAQADEISVVLEKERISVSGDAAFVYADARFVGVVGGEAFELPARWTAGLVHAEDGWQVMQCHFSVAYGEQTEGESFPG
jgi:ketosteroid isomerase-like protein